MAQPRSSDPIPSGPWDVVVIGAGAAGLMTCLDLPQEFKVLLLNRNTGRRSSSRWAQGGIAAVTRKEDSADSHAEDTVLAGAGLCDGDAVRLLVQEAPHCVERLEQLGMAFDRDQDGLATTLEAATATGGCCMCRTAQGEPWWMCCGIVLSNGQDCCIAAACA